MARSRSTKLVGGSSVKTNSKRNLPDGFQQNLIAKELDMEVTMGKGNAKLDLMTELLVLY